MSKGTLLTIGFLGGEVVGALVPLLWGDEVFSLFSLIGGQVGAIVGVGLMDYLISDKE